MKVVFKYFVFSTYLNFYSCNLEGNTKNKEISTYKKFLCFQLHFTLKKYKYLQLKKYIFLWNSLLNGKIRVLSRFSKSTNDFETLIK